MSLRYVHQSQGHAKREAFRREANWLIDLFADMGVVAYELHAALDPATRDILVTVITSIGAVTISIEIARFVFDGEDLASALEREFTHAIVHGPVEPPRTPAASRGGLL